MADIIIPDECMLVTSSWSMVGKSNPFTTTMGVHVDSGTGPSDVCDEIRNGWILSGGFCAATAMGTPFTFLGVTGIYNDGGVLIGASAVNTPVVGTATNANPMIASSSFLVSKQTGRIGRHFRGRGFWPIMGLNEAGVDAMGNIEPTSYGIVADQVEATTDFWQASINWQTVLLHTDTVVTPAFTPITGWALGTRTKTQRRRLNH
jgi:hypothetical protein